MTNSGIGRYCEARWSVVLRYVSRVGCRTQTFVSFWRCDFACLCLLFVWWLYQSVEVCFRPLDYQMREGHACLLACRELLFVVP